MIAVEHMGGQGPFFIYIHERVSVIYIAVLEVHAQSTSSLPSLCEYVLFAFLTAYAHYVRYASVFKYRRIEGSFVALTMHAHYVRY